jgi:hypothetical protein
LTLIVVSVAGFGLVNILRNEYKTNAESEIRNNLNRATEFISDETRRAEIIFKNREDIVRPDGNRIPSDAQMTLALKLPNYRDQIIYYTTSASHPWIGPRVLHRWGPPLDSNGNYELVDGSGDPIPNGSSEEVTNANWVHSALVDMMSDYRQVPDTDCDGWNRVPPEIDYVNGFFVCVNDAQNLVRLRLNSEIPLTSTTTTRDGRSTEQDKAVYSTDTKIFVRSGTGAVSPACGSPFVVNRSNPNRPELNITCNTTPNIVQVNSSSSSGNNFCTNCYVRNPWMPDPIHLPPTGLNLPARPGDTFLFTGPNFNTLYGNTGRQTVEIYTNQNLQGTTLYPNLTNNQVLYVVTDTRRRVTYHFLVTF